MTKYLDCLSHFEKNSEHCVKLLKQYSEKLTLYEKAHNSLRDNNNNFAYGEISKTIAIVRVSFILRELQTDLDNLKGQSDNNDIREFKITVN